MNEIVFTPSLLRISDQVLTIGHTNYGNAVGSQRLIHRDQERAYVQNVFHDISADHQIECFSERQAFRVGHDGCHTRQITKLAKVSDRDIDSDDGFCTASMQQASKHPAAAPKVEDHA